MRYIKRRHIAAMLGCSISLVAIWEKSRFLPPAKKEANRFRFWPEKQILDWAKRKNFVLRAVRV